MSGIFLEHSTSFYIRAHQTDVVDIHLMDVDRNIMVQDNWRKDKYFACMTNIYLFIYVLLFLLLTSTCSSMKEEDGDGCFNNWRWESFNDPIRFIWCLKADDVLAHPPLDALTSTIISHEIDDVLNQKTFNKPNYPHL